MIVAISDYDEGSRYPENYILFYIVVSFAKRIIFETCRLVLWSLFTVSWILWMNINESWILLSCKFCLLARIHECFILACPIILYVYDISLFSISHPLFAVSAILSNCTTARPTTFIGIPIIRRPLFAVSILGSLLPFQFFVLRRGVDERNMLSELENWFLRVHSGIFNWFEESCYRERFILFDEFCVVEHFFTCCIC